MKIQYLLKNSKGRDFVCGDLHGCFDLLEDKLKSVHFDPSQDRLFSVGDNIDRGTDSSKALHYFQQDWFYSIRGNHEQMFLDWCIETIPSFRAEAFRFHIHNGGIWVADYLGVHIQDLADEILEDQPITEKYPALNRWIEAINQLPYAIEIKSSRKKIGLIHAEIPKGVSWTSLETELNKTSVLFSTLYSRKYIHCTRLLPYRIKGVDEIYCGHTIVKTRKTRGNVHYIDTGAFSHDNLTLIQLEN